MKKTHPFFFCHRQVLDAPVSKALGRLLVLSMAITHSVVPVLSYFLEVAQMAWDATRQGWGCQILGPEGIPGCHDSLSAHSWFALLCGVFCRNKMVWVTKWKNWSSLLHRQILKIHGYCSFPHDPAGMRCFIEETRR